MHPRRQAEQEKESMCIIQTILGATSMAIRQGQSKGYEMPGDC